MAFQPEGITLSLDAILPTRQVQLAGPSDRYHTILASLRKFGFLVEPLVVYPLAGQSGSYILLDGHWRMKALREAGMTEAFCLLAKDDEAFTYNYQVNRLAPIQENAMILNALKKGVSDEDVAEALNMSVEKVRASRDLLRGIHQDAVHLLRDKPVTPAALHYFRRVKPSRQVEMAEMMVSAGIYTAAYAEMLLAGTIQAELLHPDKPKHVRKLRAEDFARMETEMVNIGRNLKLAEVDFGENMLELSVAGRYVERLLGNARVERYLHQHHPDLLHELKAVVHERTLAAR